MSHFVRNALEKSLIAYDKYGPLLLDKFIMMILYCSFNWEIHPNLKIADVADVEVVIIEVLDQHHSSKVETFNQNPFKRIFMALLNQFHKQFKMANTTGEIDKLQRKNDILVVFADIFKKISPLKYPAFAFAWLELISSPCFMPQMLSSNPEFNIQEKWFKMHELFSELFGFLKENIYENSEDSTSLEKFFEGTMKTVAIVLHDYPEFLVHYSFQFINKLPLYRTGNLRNMILAAFPKTFRMPDPKHDITQLPKDTQFTNYDSINFLKQNVSSEDYDEFKGYLDMFISTGDLECIEKVCEYLENSQVIINDRKIINTGVVHATLLYLAQDVNSISDVKKLEGSSISKKYEVMCDRLSTPVRDILLNAMFNELRLLSKTTVYFMNVLIDIFRNMDDETITSSQIVRILLERSRPPNIFPWGLLAFKHRLCSEKKFKSMNMPNSN